LQRKVPGWASGLLQVERRVVAAAAAPAIATALMNETATTALFIRFSSPARLALPGVEVYSPRYGAGTCSVAVPE
jgi:hypothetical protein